MARGRKKIKVTNESEDLHNKVSNQIAVLIHRGITQNEIAEALSLYQAEVSQLYRKKRNFPENKIIAIKSQLEKLVDEFNYEDEDISEVQKVEEERSFSNRLIDQMTQLELSPIDLAEISGLSYQTINLIRRGITSNPQEKTKRKIQKALDEVAKNRKLKIEKIDLPKTKNESERLFLGLPFNKEEIDQAPNLIGVYAIHDSRGYPTYIGKGKIKTRLKDHSDRRAFLSPKVASTFSYYIVQEEDEKTKSEKQEAGKRALLLEKILTKFAGNTILLNIKNREDLSND